VDVSADHFVVCIQNHDQVGNRAAGDRLTTIVPFAARKLAAALYLLSPYVPMLFMGEEYGETNPFLYFVSHGDEKLVEAVRTGRREEFKAFGWGSDIPDPQAVATFERSRLDRTKSATPEGAAILAVYRTLLRLRREERALRPGDADVAVQHDETAGWIRLTLTPRDARGAPLIALFNLSKERREVALTADGAPVKDAMRIFATDDPTFAPGGRAGGITDYPRTQDVATVGPLTAVLYKVGARA
jgi:maltooligosyltrehalose trehalohydrolase